ncbi:MAG TPA: ATP-binding protein [Bryobacteraceae bacterium]|nr:ATP-binding protein [Bryobacteraceae bacterium]
MAVWFFAIRPPSIPHRSFRIGFEEVPPVQMRMDGGYTGLAVETIQEAARRAGVSLEWVETGLSSDESLSRGLVDLWPIMLDLPERRKHFHITQPWLHTSHTLVLRAATEAPGPDFTGRIALLHLRVHSLLARQEFPQAQVIPFTDVATIVKEVCRGTVAAGFLEARAALAALRDKPAECSATKLRVQTFPRLTLPLAIGSTRGAAAAADRIRREIGNLFRDGTLAATMAKYSYYGVDDTWVTYDLMAALERSRWIAWGVAALAVCLSLALWQAFALHQRRQLEAARRQNELRYKEVFDHFSECVFVLDVTSDGRFKIAGLNPAEEKATGLSNAAVTGKYIEDVLPQDVATRAAAHYRGCLEAGTVIHYDEELSLPTGVHYFHTNLIPLRNDAGKIHRVVGCCMDFTDLKRSQEEALARQTLESVGTLASGIAHDFNNLLGGIHAQAELALTGSGTGEFPEEQLKAIREVAIRGAQIVSQLLIYAGKDVEVPELVSVSQAIEEMLELLKVSVSRRATLEIALADDLQAVRARAAQIRQIAMNLVTNASDAIGDRDGTIRLATRRVTLSRSEATAAKAAEGEYVQLSVSDTGEGMSPETQARAFDPFFTTKSAGRGLGLGVVYSIVRNLGGTIRLASELGKGTTVDILLRCAGVPSVSTKYPVSRAGETARPPQEFSILVVEDEEPLREAVVRLLRKKGFAVREAANGSAAIDLLRAKGSRIDAMLLDMTIPGASSYEVVAEAAASLPDIRVVLTSAYSQQMVAAKMTASQIRGFIRKPFSLAELLQTLHTAFDGRTSAAAAENYEAPQLK